VDVGPTGLAHLDLHQLRRLTHGERAKHQRFDEAEDRRVRADAEGECHDDDRGEARRPECGACCVADVSCDFVEPAAVARGQHGLLHLLKATEIEHRETVGFVR
jgi:hypothetical protein